MDIKEILASSFEDSLLKLYPSNLRGQAKCMPKHVDELKAIDSLYGLLSHYLPPIYRSKSGSRIDNGESIMYCKVPFVEGLVDNISLYLNRQQWDVVYCILGGAYRPALVTLRHMLEMACFTYAAALDKRILTGNPDDSEMAMSFYDFIEFIMENDARQFQRRLSTWINREKPPTAGNSEKKISSIDSVSALLKKMRPDSFEDVQYQHSIEVNLSDILHKENPELGRFIKNYYDIDFDDYIVELGKDGHLARIYDKSRSIVFELCVQGGQGVQVTGNKEIDAEFKAGILALKYTFRGDNAIKHLNSRLSRHAHSALFRRVTILSNPEEDDADGEYPQYSQKRFHNTLKLAKMTSEVILSVLVLAAYTDISYYSPSRALDFLTGYRDSAGNSIDLLKFENLAFLINQLIAKNDPDKIEQDRARVETEEERFENEQNECSQCAGQHYPDQLEQGKCDAHDGEGLYFVEEVFDW